MASWESVYGGASFDSDSYGAGMGNPFSVSGTDATPKAVALMLLFWGGVLYLLHYYGFRFNFGVSGGR